MFDRTTMTGRPSGRFGSTARRRVPSVTIVAVVVLLALAAAMGPGGPAGPAPAWAADEFTFEGLGYGHGVGMSQWGAWAAAREGASVRDILAFYYDGVELTHLDPADPEITVRLSSRPWKSVSTITQNFSRVDISPAGETFRVVVVEPDGSRRTEDVEAGETVSIQPAAAGGVVVLTPSDELTGARAYVNPRAAEVFGLGLHAGGTAYEPRRYRGRVRVEPSDTDGSLAVYNLVPMEDYVRSIAEVHYDWATEGGDYYAYEAVKAQAVAARTYAMANLDPYLNDNQWDQVYRGYDFELQYPGIARAAADTRDMIMTYDGEVVSTFFSSSSGGYTAAWGGSGDGYLLAKPDPWSLEAPPDNPGHRWEFSVDQATLTDKVSSLAPDVGDVTGVQVHSRQTADEESHVDEFLIRGRGGTAVVDGKDFRRLFGYSTMRSTLVTRIDGPGFADVGPGHLYHDEIMAIAHRGLVNGYPDDTFRPESSTSRWQFAKMAVGAHNELFPGEQIELTDVSTAPFADVPARPGVLGDESDWVAAAKDAGLVRGVDETRFSPYVAIRRDQVATMLVRAMGAEEEAAAVSASSDGFVDVPRESPHWPTTAYLRAEGILRGYEEPADSGVFRLRAGEDVTRMHVAVLLDRILPDSGRLE